MPPRKRRAVEEAVVEDDDSQTLEEPEQPSASGRRASGRGRSGARGKRGRSNSTPSTTVKKEADGTESGSTLQRKTSGKRTRQARSPSNEAAQVKEEQIEEVQAEEEPPGKLKKRESDGEDSDEMIIRLPAKTSISKEQAKVFKDAKMAEAPEELNGDGQPLSPAEKLGFTLNTNQQVIEAQLGNPADDPLLSHAQADKEAAKTVDDSVQIVDESAADNKEPEEELVVSEGPGGLGSAGKGGVSQRSRKRKSQVIEDASEEDVVDEDQVAEAVKGIGEDWRPEQVDLTISRSPSAEREDRFKKPRPPAKRAKIGEQKSGKKAVTPRGSGKSMRGSAAQRTGSGNRGGRGGSERGGKTARRKGLDKHTSNAASKDNANDASIVGDFSADQQPQMEPKTMPQHEKDRPDPSPKSPGAKSTIKALKQANRGAVQAKQSADVSQEDEQPVSRKSPSAEIIPESLEPSQPITAGHAKGQQRSRHTASTGPEAAVVEAITSASGEKETMVENVLERLDQVSANLKLCTELFAPPERRASKLFTQIAADVEYLSSLKVTPTILSRTGVGKYIKDLTKPYKVLQQRPEFHKKAETLLTRWQAQFQAKSVPAAPQRPNPNSVPAAQSTPSTPRLTAMQPCASGTAAPAVGPNGVAGSAPLGQEAGALPPLTVAAPVQPSQQSAPPVNGARAMSDGQPEIRRRVRLVLEEAFKPPEYVFLPSDAAEVAEEELYKLSNVESEVPGADKNSEQLYLKHLQRTLSWLQPGGSEFLEDLTRAIMTGKIHPADVMSLAKDELQNILANQTSS